MAIVYIYQDNIAVTGVGIYNDPDGGDWIAPLDVNGRWDDEGYDFPDSDCIGVLRQRPVNGRFGFPFHEACWSLLDTAYSPNEVPCKALFEVCKSLPFPSEGTGLSWGHTFGGLVMVNNQDYYPWEDRFVDRDGDSLECKSARHDPFHVPEIQLLHSERPKTPKFSKRFAEPKMVLRDCITALPQEICFQIASYLPTADALRARQASRSFVPIFYSNQFWASRFRGKNAERCWLFESHEWDNTSSDWRWLYYRTNKAHRNGGIRNRERVWKLIQQVQQALASRSSEPSVIASPTSDPDTLTWLEATGNLHPEADARPYPGFNDGCRRFYEQQATIPSQLGQIVFSVVQIGDAEYIAGMRLIPMQGAAVELGYRTEGRESVLDLAILKGFNLAVGSRGIQGLQCMFEGDQTSPWIGCAQGSPKTRRLAISGPIAAVKAGFDVSMLHFGPTGQH